MHNHTFQSEPATPPLAEKHGILLVNLGTPDALDFFSMRRYLRQFLNDPRVVEPHRPLVWKLFLDLFLLNIIPFKSRRGYAKIWDFQRGESPLRTITRLQAEKLAQRLTTGERDAPVAWAMRYGSPDILSGLQELKAQGCSHVIVLPLYPHYASATVGSVYDALGEAVQQLRWAPALTVVPPYFAEPSYIEALAQSVRDALQSAEVPPHVLLVSYHGLPVRHVEAGDPYYAQCLETSRLLAQALGREEGFVRTTFQSKFGREPWLTPATDAVLAQLPAEGVKHIAVISPGFASDCVETLEELAVRGKETFLEAGGEGFTFVPCLNASEAGIGLLAGLVEQSNRSKR